MNKSEVRRERLRRLVSNAGGHNAFVKRHNLSPSRSSYISQVLNGYSFGETGARNLAKELRLDPNYFDLSDEKTQETSNKDAQSGPIDAYWKTVSFCWAGLSDAHKDAVAVLVNTLYTIDNPGAVDITNPRRRKTDHIDLGTFEIDEEKPAIKKMA